MFMRIIVVNLQEQIDFGIETEGSNLSGVSSRVSWEEVTQVDTDNLNEEDKENRLFDTDGKRGSRELDRPQISQYGKNYRHLCGNFIFISR